MVARPPVSLVVTEMTPDDIPAVHAIESASFPTPWPPYAFRDEIESNRMAKYLVVRAGHRVIAYAGIWPRDRQNPPQLKNRFETGDGFDWFMEYEFVDVRPGDEFYSAFTSSLNGVEIEALS